MPRVIRQKNENGVLVERHIEGSKFKPRKWLANCPSGDCCQPGCPRCGQCRRQPGGAGVACRRIFTGELQGSAGVQVVDSRSSGTFKVWL